MTGAALRGHRWRARRCRRPDCVRMPVSMVRRARALLILLVAALALAPPAGAATVPAGAAPGTVVAAAPLDRALWVPETTRRAYLL